NRIPPATRLRRPGRRALILFACVAVALLYPISSTVVPRWKLKVVDNEGNPWVGQFVRQTWKDYTLEPDAGENLEDKWTDAEGYVDFPERTITASVLQRVLFPAWAALMTSAHGSTGVSADVLVWGPDNSPREAKYIRGQPLPD